VIVCAEAMATVRNGNSAQRILVPRHARSPEEVESAPADGSLDTLGRERECVFPELRERPIAPDARNDATVGPPESGPAVSEVMPLESISS